MYEARQHKEATSRTLPEQKEKGVQQLVRIRDNRENSVLQNRSSHKTFNTTQRLSNETKVQSNPIQLFKIGLKVNDTSPIETIDTDEITKAKVQEWATKQAREYIISYNISDEKLREVINSNKAMFANIFLKRGFASVVYTILNKLEDAEKTPQTPQTETKKSSKVVVKDKFAEAPGVKKDVDETTDRQSFHRYLCKDEGEAARSEGKLQRHKTATTYDARCTWLSRINSGHELGRIPSKSKYVAEFSMTYNRDTFRNLIFVGSEEAAYPNNILAKTTELGAYGVGINLLDQFKFISLEKRQQY